MTVNAGGLATVSGGDLNIAAAATNNGTINIASGRTANFAGNVGGVGNVHQRGTASFAAAFSPGNGAATVDFGGKMTLADGFAQLSTRRHRAAQRSTRFTWLAISLRRTSASNALRPSPAHAFDILDWGSLSGTFSSLILPGGGLTWDTSQLYTTGVLTVGGLLGDYNHNGIVDSADYTVWRDSLGQTGTALAADGNDNGMIDAGDFAVWTTNFGHTLGGGGGSGAGANAAVPEPATLLPMCLGAVFLIRRRLLTANR